MLQIPAFRYFPEYRVTAYQDDTQFWKFYLIPDYVSIRRDFNDNPVFLLIKYAFDDQDREENPDLPRGGGYMVFDVEMSVREADYPAITAALQQNVNDIWNQMKSLAENRNQDIRTMRVGSYHYLNGLSTSLSLGEEDVTLGLGTEGPGAPPGDAPPKVIFSHPTWTEGTFRVSAPPDPNLVSHIVAEGPLSLTGNNVAAVSLSLTSAGATFMEKTLTNLDGSGATDLTPISVLFQLKFLARVPPVKLNITADSRSLFRSAQSISHDYQDNDCSEDVMTHSEHHVEMAIESGLISVQFDAGTLELSDDFVQELRSGAMKMVMDMIKEKWFDKKEAEPSDDDPDDPTRDFVNRESDVYYLKSDFREESMHIAYNERIESLQRWPVNPQGTLQTFLANVSASEMRKYVRVVDLTDPFFQTLGLKVTCFADWDNEPIAFVEAQIRYSGRDENNQEVEKVETFTFNKANTVGEWDPSLIGRKREYSYRWRVGFQGREPGEFTGWERDTSPNLNISVADPGKIAIRVMAGNVDFNQITKQVQVDLSYADSDVQEESTTVILANGQLENNYQRYIYTEWDRPVRYRTRFFLKNDQMIESDWQQTLNRQLLINEPSSVNRLDVQLVPVGDWSNVLQTIVNLRYIDLTSSYFLDDNRRLTTPDQFLSWAVVVKDPTKRKFQYKVLTSFKDGSLPVESQWLEADGDQTLPILVKQKPKLNVKLLPTLVDFAVTPVVEVTMRYDDTFNNLHKVETFALTSPAEQLWSFPISRDEQRAYRYQVTYNTKEGQVVNVPEATTDETALVLQKLLVPEVTALIQPKMIDYMVTPVVEVYVEYEDPNRGIECEETLIFTDAQSQRFRFQVASDSPQEYQVTITYYLANGNVVTHDPVQLDKSQIVIPRYVATA
jgi:hypothetical protein